MFVFFLKSRSLLNIFYCFCMFANIYFLCLGCVYLSKWPVLWCETFCTFYVKTKILEDFFHICISVPFNLFNLSMNKLRSSSLVTCLRGWCGWRASVGNVLMWTNMLNPNVGNYAPICVTFWICLNMREILRS